MTRAMTTLGSALVLLVLASGLDAQEAFDFQPSFEAGDTFEWQIESMTTAPDGSVTEVAATMVYTVTSADPYSFRMRQQLGRLVVELPDGRRLGYAAEGAEPLPEALEVVLQLLGSLEVTYDTDWRVVNVEGLGRLIEPFIQQLPDPLPSLLRQAVNIGVQPALANVMRSAQEQQLIASLYAGSWQVGEFRGSATSGLAFDYEQSLEIVSIEENDTWGPTLTAKVTSGRSVRLPLEQLQRANQKTEGTITFLQSGMPLSMALQSEQGGAVTQISGQLAGRQATGEPSDLWSKIRAAQYLGDYDEVQRLLADHLAENPNDARAWGVLSSVLQALAQGKLRDSGGKTTDELLELFIRSAEAYRKHVKLNGGSPDNSVIPRDFATYTLYNEACGHALKGRPEKAMAALNDAVAAGYDDAEHMSADPDLASLREREDFQALIAKLQEGASDQHRRDIEEAFEAHEPFAFDFSLEDTAGNVKNKSDYAGRVLIVDVWGTWCPPCRAEVPHFVKLYRNYHERGLSIVGLNYEGVPDAEAKPIIDKFVAENDIPYPCLLGDEQTQQQIPDFQGYPTTLFIDRQGKVRLKLVGYHEYEALEAAVTKLLDEKE